MTHPIPDEALEGDIAVLGKKGGGKTYTSKGLVERLLDMGRRVLVLDPLGIWAGLRTSADGEKPGYAVAIFGGERGDLPLDPAAAEPLARIIASENLPAVLDLSELTKHAQQAFLLRFLIELKRVNREALTIVLEEADVFAPQNPMGDDSKALFGEIDWITRRGRFRGFRLISITQRPARLHKDVLSQANCLIIHRLGAPQDRDAIKDWVDGHGDRDAAKAVFDTLATLKVGEAWILAQEPQMLERASFPTIKTLDTSSTPKAGERRIEPKTLAQVDVAAVRAALADETTPVEGSKRGKPTEVDPAAVEQAFERGRAEGHAAGYDAGHAAGLFSSRQTLLEINKLASDQLRWIDAQYNVATPQESGSPAATARAPTPRKAATAIAPSKPTAAGSAEGTVSKTAQKIVDVVLAAYPVSLTFKAAALRAGASPRSSQFRTYRAQVEGHPHIIVQGDRLLAAITDQAAPSSPTDAIEQFAQRLQPSWAAILRAIAAAGQPLSRDEVADRAGVSRTSSGLTAGLRELLAMELIERSGSDFVITDALKA